MTERMNAIADMMRRRLDECRLPIEIEGWAFAREVVILRNFDVRIRMPGAKAGDTAGRIETIKEIMPDMVFTDVSLTVSEDAIVAQFTMSGTLPNGEKHELPFTQIFHVTDGLIDRVDYYSSASQDMKGMAFMSSGVAAGMNAPPDPDIEMTMVYASAEAPPTARKAPYAIEAEAGRTYWWCSCGRSKNQPLCDGSHLGTGKLPVQFRVDVAKTVYFCGCKESLKAPLCDGTHNSLQAG